MLGIQVKKVMANLQVRSRKGGKLTIFVASFVMSAKLDY